MFNTALRIVNRVQDAEDILQESFTDAFVELNTFENRSTFGAWLRQIVVYKSIGFIKKQKLSFVEMGMAGDPREENELDESEILYTVDRIRQAMQQLPDGYRTVLALYLFEGFDHGEIAELLHVTPSTVRTQYIRGKQKLLQLLKTREHYEY